MPTTQTHRLADLATELVTARLTADPAHTADPDWAIHSHGPDEAASPYIGTVVYERTEWLSWDALDAINEALETDGIEVEAERLSPYEIAFLPLD